jgi:hypothetical protein
VLAQASTLKPHGGLKCARLVAAAEAALAAGTAQLAKSLLATWTRTPSTHSHADGCRSSAAAAGWVFWLVTKPWRSSDSARSTTRSDPTRPSATTPRARPISAEDGPIGPVTTTNRLPPETGAKTIIGVMEIVMQPIRTEWTKRSRGAPEATVRNGVRNSRVVSYCTIRTSSVHGRPPNCQLWTSMSAYRSGVRTRVPCPGPAPGPTPPYPASWCRCRTAAARTRSARPDRAARRGRRPAPC